MPPSYDYFSVKLHAYVIHVLIESCDFSVFRKLFYQCCVCAWISVQVSILDAVYMYVYVMNNRIHIPLNSDRDLQVYSYSTCTSDSSRLCWHYFHVTWVCTFFNPVGKTSHAITESDLAMHANHVTVHVQKYLNYLVSCMHAYQLNYALNTVTVTHWSHTVTVL